MPLPEFLRTKAVLAIAAGAACLFLFSCCALSIVAAVYFNRPGKPSRYVSGPGGAPSPSKQDVKPSKPPNNKPEVAASTGAPGLWEEYGNNAVQADAKYKDKSIKLTGSVASVRTDEKGRYFVGFSVVASGAVSKATYDAMSPQQKKWFNEGYPPNVVCYIAAEAKAAFAAAKPETMIELIGTCRGMKSDDSVWRGYVVVLEDCKLAPQ